VIPVRNESAAVGMAVASALAQDYGGPLEVVVADGMSTDGTRDLLESFTGDTRVRIVDNPAGTTSAALNVAVAASMGEVIVRCDAHSVLPPGYVAAAVARLEAEDAAVVGGIQEAVGEGPFSRAVAYAMASPLGAGGAAYRSSGTAGATDTVYLGVFRREALAAVGSFDESLLRNQDYELNYRIRRSGRLVYLDPSLRVRYLPRSRPGPLWRQYFGYGTWKRVVIRRSPGSLRARQAAAPLLVVGLGASAVAAFTPLAPLSLVVPGAYGAAVVAAAIGAAISRRDPAGLLLTVALPTMHLAWGSGFLLGRAKAAPPRVGRLDR